MHSERTPGPPALRLREARATGTQPFMTEVCEARSDGSPPLLLPLTLQASRMQACLSRSWSRPFSMEIRNPVGPPSTSRLVFRRLGDAALKLGPGRGLGQGMSSSVSHNTNPLRRSRPLRPAAHISTSPVLPSPRCPLTCDSFTPHQGYLVGNPVADTELDANSVPAYLASQSLISQAMYEAALKACDGGRFHGNPSRACSEAQDAMDAAGERAWGCDVVWCLCCAWDAGWAGPGPRVMGWPVVGRDAVARWGGYHCLRKSHSSTPSQLHPFGVQVHFQCTDTRPCTPTPQSATSTTTTPWPLATTAGTPTWSARAPERWMRSHRWPAPGAARTARGVWPLGWSSTCWATPLGAWIKGGHGSGGEDLLLLLRETESRPAAQHAASRCWNALPATT